ncbi:50S ribosomal protein L6 [Candidatus Pacearchaeota archaeon]|nr:50S ribosomal protein L6 [Candidatus Pacearchaeota archaeon]
MKKELFVTIDIPEEVEVKIEGEIVETKGVAGENKREFDTTNLTLEKKDNQIIIGNKKATKREKKMMNTLASHIKNMIKGVQKKFEYQLKICFSHFPITVEILENEAIVKNFLGEKIPRKVIIPPGVEVKADKEIIIVSAVDKELAGQAAANFEKATKVPMKDRRVFQDGIYITDKAGRKM